MGTTVDVSVDELRALFAGVRVPDDQQNPDGDPWSTRPCHSATLAAVIANRIGAASEDQLRMAIYGSLDPLLIDVDATVAIRNGFRTHERTSKRGL